VLGSGDKEVTRPPQYSPPYQIVRGEKRTTRPERVVLVGLEEDGSAGVEVKGAEGE